MDVAYARASAAGMAVRGLVGLPLPVVRRLGGRPVPAAAGLEPEMLLVARLAERLAGDPPPDIDESRRLADAQSRFMVVRPRTPVTAEDGEAAGIPVRTFTPADPVPGAPPLVFFHGGGWVQRSIETHDPSCRMLAHLSGIRVISVEYRLAPEHTFPAAYDDALAAYLAITDRLGPAAVGGDSAGGNLAAAVALGCRDGAGPLPVFQWLLYPVCDVQNRSGSWEAFAAGHYLTADGMQAFIDVYVPDVADRTDPRVSPLLAASHAGLPPAYVATALADPLRDEAEAYAAKLRDAGVAAAVQRFPQLHGFFNLTGARCAREALAVTAGALRAGLT